MSEGSAQERLMCSKYGQLALNDSEVPTTRLNVLQIWAAHTQCPKSLTCKVECCKLMAARAQCPKDYQSDNPYHVLVLVSVPGFGSILGRFWEGPYKGPPPLPPED